MIYTVTRVLSALDAVEFMFVGIGAISVVVAVVVYARINAHRDALARVVKEKGSTHDVITYTAEELREMGDRAPDFRYTL